MDQEIYDLLTESSPAAVDVILTGILLRDEYSPAVEAKALRKVYEFRAAYYVALNEVGVLVTPVTPTVAIPHPKLKSINGERSTIIEKISLSVRLSSNISPFNSTGHPAMSIPCGFGTPEDGSPGKLPIGMQLIAGRWDE
jgi:amidase